MPTQEFFSGKKHQYRFVGHAVNAIRRAYFDKSVCQSSNDRQQKVEQCSDRSRAARARAPFRDSALETALRTRMS